MGVSGTPAQPLAAHPAGPGGLVIARLWRLARTPSFRKHPVSSISKRLRWHLHWRLRPRTPFIIPFYGGSQLRLGRTSASSGVYLNGGFSDPDISSLFIDFLRPGMRALDCGAHIGEYTVLFASLVGSGGEVHAFEPDQRVFGVLESNVRRNKLSNVTLNNIALSDREGTDRFAVADDATMSSLTRFTSPSSRPVVETTTTTLDSYLQQHDLKTVDAVKIDIEGAELAALGAAEFLLGSVQPSLVFVECDDHENTPLVERILQGHGYVVVVRHDSRHWHPHIIARREAS